MYVIQFIASSCDPCSCETVQTFERLYNGIELKSWDTSGFQNQEVIGEVYKNAFGLTISIGFDLEQIASFKPKINLKSFAFLSAYAFSCDCPPDIFINKDPMASISIMVTNLKTQETSIITDHFTTYGYNGEQLSFTDFFENREDWQDGFQVDMTTYKDIPDFSMFTVKVVLESGKEIIEKSSEIHFK